MADVTVSPKRVLIIDDEKHLLIVLAAFIRRAGYTVLTADNGKDGLRMALESQPDLILCDVMMPPPNGFELKKVLAESPRTAEIPFIFLTARSAASDKVFGMEAGADDYITKPFNDQELLARIKAVLRRSQKPVGHAVPATPAVSMPPEMVEQQMAGIREEMMKRVTHELGLPLTRIMASLEMVLMKRYVNPQEQEISFQNSLNSAAFLRGLIDDFIIMASFDDGKPNTFRQIIHLNQDLLEPIQQSYEKYGKKSIQVVQTVPKNLELYAPKIEFRRAVYHLVDNAFKFSPERGKVEIAMVPHGVGGGIFTVTDQGSGIPAGQKDYIFERFYQGSNGVDSDYNGLGIGLNVVRIFALSIGGEVNFPDTPIGCKVRLTIPTMY
jgi:DNA-binding response OmpR family regulator